ncbi:MAG: hypothetical protein RLZZ252_333 [Bacteroidota bacterium]|jgi:hypothetical protein
MQKIPQNTPHWLCRLTSILLIAVIPMLGVFQLLGIKYQRHITKQCIFNQMDTQDLETLFLDEQQFNEPEPGEEFWLNGNKYDAIRISPTLGGWMVIALNDKIEKLAEQAMRAENSVPLHPSAKKYNPYNKNWQFVEPLSVVFPVLEYSFDFPIHEIPVNQPQINSVFQPPEVHS